MTISRLTIDTEFEQGLKYSFPDDFSEETVEKPTPFLISKVLEQLIEAELTDKLESETAKLLLACCSR